MENNKEFLEEQIATMKRILSKIDEGIAMLESIKADLKKKVKK